VDDPIINDFPRLRHMILDLCLSDLVQTTRDIHFVNYRTLNAYFYLFQHGGLLRQEKEIE
jgi:septin family protein